jgi:hypothetical protein
VNRTFAQGSQGAQWDTGQLIDTPNRLTINMFQQDDSDWNCHHVIAAEDRIVVETRACLRDKTTSVVANAVANHILDSATR